MSGRNKVNVVCALGDEFKINFAQAIHGDFLAFVHAADFIILAENAVQVAAAEKHGAAAPGAADAGLLPPVQHGPCHPQSGGHTAESAAVLRSALCPAVTGT